MLLTVHTVQSALDYVCDDWNLSVVVLCCDRVGPLDSQVQYTVTAAKDGFIFSSTDDGIIGHFRSFKLGKIQVQVSYRAIISCFTKKSPFSIY